MCLILEITKVSFCQSELMLYQLNGTLPESISVNPALFPEYKFSLGLPGISSTYVSVKSGRVSFDNLFASSGDSLHFNPGQFAGRLDKKNRFDVNSTTQLFLFGVRVRRNFFSVGLNERISGNATYPKSLIQLLAEGNGAKNLVNRLNTLENINMRLSAYHELAFGYGRELTGRLTLGIRIKYLSGVTNLDLSHVHGNYLTNMDSIYLSSQPFVFNTSGKGLFDGSADVLNTITNFKNHGLAIDLGGKYWITPDIEVSASLLDLGQINWKNDTEGFSFNKVVYAFKGLDLLNLVKTNPVGLNNELDSIKGLYDPTSLKNNSYKSKLTGKFYLSGAYHLGKIHTFSTTFYGDVFKSTFNPAMSLAYTLKLGRIWTVGINGSYQNKSFTNLGMGTSLNLGAFQLYFVTEDMVSLTRLNKAKNIDARVGINLVFGRVKKREWGRKLKTEGTLPQEEDSLLVQPEQMTDSSTVALSANNPDIISVQRGDNELELEAGYYVVIASFIDKSEVDDYILRLTNEGYAAQFGYQSVLGKYLVYLMNFPNDRQRAIDKKNELSKSFGPGLEPPWVLQVYNK